MLQQFEKTRLSGGGKLQREKTHHVGCFGNQYWSPTALTQQ